MLRLLAIPLVLVTSGCAAWHGGLSVEAVLRGTQSVADAIEREPSNYSPVFQAPLRHMHVNSRFGHRSGGHAGVDLRAAEGTPIYAAADGVVVYEDNRISGYGLSIILRHRHGYATLYAHASETRVGIGDHVTRGQCIAYAGQSGNASGPHLHFEIRDGMKALDPLPALAILARTPKTPVALLPPTAEKDNEPLPVSEENALNEE